MTSDTDRSRAFYRALGPAGLAIRTKPEWDALIVREVVRLLPASGRVLDVGCGYGDWLRAYPRNCTVTIRCCRDGVYGGFLFRYREALGSNC
jgi:SAM-dependent methyltransferase